ncbi:molybdopterin-dependent oxidoreductase [Pseudonocardia endophytica]|uniref:Anaerobic selenocysteine-containing dehydrogenase n=1 Tax=Pseudonocardia endophytica TaxID=401976 RepID=A0A4V2PIR1_PSEEN|nr:molybdopterin-dependent oxidoreductase [Pseudonocardia endophytica]TCK25646.1 anaerobic selenocysteine-containing dehydrogenase [Pseudonocardia endophytica]
MTETHGYCTLCRSRCGAIYTVEEGVLSGVRPDPDHPTGGALCPKGRAAPEIVHSDRRLTRPLRRTTPKSDPDPGWREISWDEALSEIATRLDGIRSQEGPERVAFSVTSPSGTSMSDSIDWVERFIRLFGSPNTCYSTEICNWHKDFAHAFTFGTALPTPDFAGTDLAVLWGQNPAKTWLAQSSALAEARQRGARLAVVDPTASASAAGAEHWLRVLPGTDAALALGIAHRLIARRGHDESFVRSWTNGPLLVRQDTGRLLTAAEIAQEATGFVVWDETSGRPETTDDLRDTGRAALFGTRRIRLADGPVDCAPAFDHYARACAAWPLDRTSDVTTVAADSIEALVEDLSASDRIAYSIWSGLGQSANATQTDRAVATLFALTGCYDAPGGNVVLPRQPVNAVTSPQQLGPDRIARGLGIERFPIGPPTQGWITARDLCASVLDAEPYRVRALVSFGGNLLLSQPDPRRTAEALRRLDFAVHTDMFLNPTAQLADIVLPVTSPWEHEAYRAGFEITREAQEHIQLRPRMVTPVGQSRPDTDIVFDLACRLGLEGEFFHGNVEAGRNHQLAPLGLTIDVLRAAPGGVRRPLPTVHRKYAEPGDGPRPTGFATRTGRVELYSELLLRHGHCPVPEHRDPAEDARFPLVLTCAKVGHFCHSQHRGINSLRSRSPAPTVRLGTALAEARGIADGDLVEIRTAHGRARMSGRVDEALHPHVVVAEHGWWEENADLSLPGSDPTDPKGSNYNLLVGDDERDPVSGSAPMRSTRCEIARIDTGAWSGTRRFTVCGRTTTAGDVTVLRLRPTDNGGLPTTRPGQHVTVSTPSAPQQARSYSLVGPAVESPTELAIAVREIPDGRVSRLLCAEADIGSELLLMTPGGSFTVPVRHSRPVVLIAAGIGLTPFLGYLETLAADGHDIPEVWLHATNRTREAIPFRGRVAELEASIRRLTVVHHISSAEEPTGGYRAGRFTAAQVARHLIDARALFYVCGPAQMIADVTGGLVARGVPRADVREERFHVPRPPLDDVAPATVTLARSGMELRWTPGEGSLLDLVEAAGVSVTHGCRVAQCESCAVTVLQGEVRTLVEPPVPLDGACLTCQAIPQGDLVLDL